MREKSSVGAPRQTRAAFAQGRQLLMLTRHSSIMLPGVMEYVRTSDERTTFVKRIEDYIHFFLDKVAMRTGIVSDVAATLAAGTE